MPRDRPDDDAAVRRRPRGQPAATSPRCASSPPRTGSQRLSMGTTQDFAVAAEEGATIVRIGLCTPATCVRAPIMAPRCREIPCQRESNGVMAFRDTWHRALVYFGLAEERRPVRGRVRRRRTSRPRRKSRTRYRERPNVRRLSSRRRRDEIDDIFADDAPPSAARASCARSAAARGRPATAAAATSACTSWCPSRSTTPRTWRTSSRTRSRSSSTCRGPRPICPSA